jgi:uncharacterized membrane protein
MTKLSKRLQYARIALCVAGLLISLYLLIVTTFSLPVACPAGSLVNCDRVLGSVYAKTFGIPNAYLGVGYFVAALLLSFYKKQPKLLALLTVAGMGFVAYFVYAEYLIGSICIWCTGAHVCALALFLISIYEIGE